MVGTYLNISQTGSNSTVERAYVRVSVVRIVRGSSPDLFPILLISTVYLDMYQFTLILTCYYMKNLHIAIAIVSILEIKTYAYNISHFFKLLNLAH